MGVRFRLMACLLSAILVSGCSDDMGMDQHGQTLTAAQFEGQWLIINYWAQWCIPCRTEIPELNALNAQLKSRGAQVLGVNFDGLQGEALRDAADTFKIAFTVLASDPAQRYGLPHNDVLPVTYIVDGKGKLRERRVGEQTAAGLLERLEALRKEG
ncbi:TlpA disulfide reductase family protein [Pseudomonas sp. LRF_L74]|uniref:TlpA disulfide reductase family protein n=1 Tax=Pseudomonas sp. LRF_L74 TaxID=3369422 RepID=UPI003F5E72CB